MLLNTRIVTPAWARLQSLLLQLHKIQHMLSRGKIMLRNHHIETCRMVARRNPPASVLFPSSVRDQNVYSLPNLKAHASEEACCAR